MINMTSRRTHTDTTKQADRKQSHINVFIKQFPSLPDSHFKAVQHIFIVLNYSVLDESKDLPIYGQNFMISKIYREENIQT